MGLIDYPQYIKYPMDLSTIHRKLREQRYRTVEEVLDDFQMIWDNCKVYNPPNSVLRFLLSGFITWRTGCRRLSRRCWSLICLWYRMRVQYGWCSSVGKVGKVEQWGESGVCGWDSVGVGVFSFEVAICGQVAFDFSSEYEGDCGVDWFDLS